MEWPRTCLTPASASGVGLDTVLDQSAYSTERLGEDLSPLDRAYEQLVVITQMTASHSSAWKTQYGLIFSASAVGTAEDYFRTLLAELVRIDPHCMSVAKAVETRLEFVARGDVVEAVRETLDRVSFSSTENLARWSQRLVGYKISNTGPLADLLTEFERAAHIRHCASHAGGYVTSNNADKLRVPAGSWIAFDSPSAVHSIVAVVTAVIRAYNQSIYEFIMDRLMQEATLSGIWVDDRPRFAPIWQVLMSRDDAGVAKLTGEPGFRTNAYQAYRSVLPAIRSRNNATDG